MHFRQLRAPMIYHGVVDFEWVIKDGSMEFPWNAMR